MLPVARAPYPRGGTILRPDILLVAVILIVLGVGCGASAEAPQPTPQANTTLNRPVSTATTSALSPLPQISSLEDRVKELEEAIVLITDLLLVPLDPNDLPFCHPNNPDAWITVDPPVMKSGCWIHGSQFQLIQNPTWRQFTAYKERELDNRLKCIEAKAGRRIDPLLFLKYRSL